MLFYIAYMTDCVANVQCITDWITDFSAFFRFWVLYFTSKVSELNVLYIICKRDTESVKVAPESVLRNRGIS